MDDGSDVAWWWSGALNELDDLDGVLLTVIDMGGRELGVVVVEGDGREGESGGDQHSEGGWRRVGRWKGVGYIGHANDMTLGRRVYLNQDRSDPDSFPTSVATTFPWR